MKKLMAMLVSAMLLICVVAVSGCEKKKESNAGKQIKHTLDRAQDAVDMVNQRQKDSVPDEEGH